MTANPPSSPRFDWRRFLQPTWLAGAISVGFHGVLFAVGPTFPSLGFEQLTEADLAAERRNVPLVELTAAEQERLPDFSSSFYDFGEFGSLDPLSPLFAEGNSRGEGDRVINSEPLLSPGRNNSPPSAYNLPFDISSIGRPRSPLPLSGGLPPLGSSGNETIDPDAMKPAAPASGQNQPPGAEALRPESGESDSLSQEDAEAIAANSNPTNTLPLEERLQAYTFDGDKTDIDEINVSYSEWLENGETFAVDLEVGDADAISSAFESAATAGILAPVSDDEADTNDEADTLVAGIIRRPLALEIEYGAGFCLTKEPQKGLIGAWVSPAGELLGEPEVIRSTGYLGLNQQAIDYIETLDFSTVESFTGYQFEVLVAYDPDNCVEVGNRAPATLGAGAAADPERDTSEEDKTSNPEKPRSPASSAQTAPSPEAESSPADESSDTAETGPEAPNRSTAEE
jgi:hypothetical protein